MYYDIKATAERIKELRTARNYTQERLADELGIDRSFLSRIEGGRKGCSVDMFINLAEIFEVSLDYLILGKQKEDTSAIKAEVRKAIEKLTELEKLL